MEPQNLDALLGRAYAQMLVGETAAARADAAAAVAVAPRSPEAIGLLVNLRVTSGEIGVGVAMTELRSVEGAESSPALLRWMAETTFTAGNHGEAIELARRTLELDSDDAFAPLTLAVALWRAGYLEEAAATIEARIAKVAGSGYLHLLLGGIQLDAGGCEAAVESFARADELDPRATELFNQHAPRTYVWRARALAGVDRLDDALAAVDAALSRQPQLAEAQALRAEIVARLRAAEEPVAPPRIRRPPSAGGSAMSSSSTAPRSSPGRSASSCASRCWGPRMCSASRGAPGPPSCGAASRCS